jgi:hypothetical protein
MVGPDAPEWQSTGRDRAPEGNRGAVTRRGCLQRGGGL